MIGRFFYGLIAFALINFVGLNSGLVLGADESKNCGEKSIVEVAFRLNETVESEMESVFYSGDDMKYPDDVSSDALRRFLRYAVIETTSHENSSTVPSSPGQLELARLLVAELKELGLTDVLLDENGFVTGTLPANIEDETVPAIGLIAHLDTSEMVSGKNVQPRLLRYRGGDVLLDSGVKIEEDEALKRQLGRWIVVTDGTTLLGGDNKAGIAAIMTALDRLIHENRPHGTVSVCFTPDEEIGKGITYLNLEHFRVQYAYTVTCGPFGQYNKETFSADKVVLTVDGHAIHPGYAFGKLVNAVQILSEIVAQLPVDRRPETTQERAPYIYLADLKGDVSSAKAVFLLRAFDEKDRKENFRILRETADAVLKQNPKAQLQWEETVQYRNIGPKIDEVPALSAKVYQAMKLSGVEPVVVPVRGGTDGSWLTERGIPTPNLFAGYYYPHSVTEWLSVDELNKSSEVLLHLIELWGEKEELQNDNK